MEKVKEMKLVDKGGIKLILITGGAGYIGSHVSRELLDLGYQVIILDNLSTGNIKAIDKRAIFINGDIGNISILNSICSNYKIDAIMHFAANCLVGESVTHPLKYYQNNVAMPLSMLDEMIKHNIKIIIFSSTCATYGIPEKLPINEKTPNNPINPYGKSKLMFEKILQDAAKSHDISYIALRYFNVAGAHESGNIGEDHEPETHLIPNIIKHMQGKLNSIEVFGNDYDTPDGTCIRDYIHIKDLTNAHVLALEYLIKSKENVTEVFNIGNEKGYSVLEIIKTCEKIAGIPVNMTFRPRRIGDPPILVASADKAKEILKWKPNNNLENIISSAWKWHQNHPNGYKN